MSDTHASLKADIDKIMTHVIGLVTKVESLSAFYTHMSDDFKRLETSLKEMRQKIHEIRSDVFALPHLVENNVSDKIDVMNSRIGILENENVRLNSAQGGRNQVFKFTATWGGKVLISVITLVGMGLTYAMHSVHNTLQHIVEYTVNREIQDENYFKNDKN